MRCCGQLPIIAGNKQVATGRPLYHRHADMPISSTTAIVRKAVIHRNREILLEAAIAATAGVIFSLITFGVLWWLMWIFCWFTIGRGSAVMVASVGTAIFVLVAVVSAWRRVDPLEHLSPMTGRQMLTQDAAGALTLATGVPIMTRHSTAGAGVVLIGGPANIFEALSLYRHRIRAGHRQIAQAAELVDRVSAGDVAIDQLDEADSQALHILSRLKFIKVVQEPGASQPVLRSTQKWRDAARSSDLVQ